MKIAVATENGSNVAQHFGRAPSYAVPTVVDGRVTGRELQPKAGHRTYAGGPSHRPVRSTLPWSPRSPTAPQ